MNLQVQKGYTSVGFGFGRMAGQAGKQPGKTNGLNRMLQAHTPSPKAPKDPIIRYLGLG